jgi:hypothetical protein
MLFRSLSDLTLYIKLFEPELFIVPVSLKNVFIFSKKAKSFLPKFI